MSFLSIDLGTTNIKVAAYNDSLELLALETENVRYLGEGDIVEFDAVEYFNALIDTMYRCCQKSFNSTPYPIRQIVLTGQAESLIALDINGVPVRNGISWLDMRSMDECEELKTAFDPEICYRTTGQAEIIPTWPITKILWMRKHEPSIYAKVDKYLLLKDFIQYRLTGKLAGEYSIYNFSHYFDITKKNYWTDILSYCGVSLDQLPPLIEPCTILGPVTKNIANQLKLSVDTTVNVGTLDHFSGMIGTGNIQEGSISESTGTVMSIATMFNQPIFNNMRFPWHYGPFKDTYVLLLICESGGISLEWFKRNFAAENSYEEINMELSKKSLPNELIFLPYITGVNPPDFNADANGVFYGIRAKHDKFDFAFAIMEGVSHLLKKNIHYIEKAGIKANTIISTGGGAKSELWLQMKADITEYNVAIPESEEAACFGAAIIGAVSEGIFPSYKEAVAKCISLKKRFYPQNSENYKKKNVLFNMLYDQITPVFKFDKHNM